MPDASDMELLQDYDRQGSEEAFAGLVRRHINLVYSAAFRHVGNAVQAEEITQAVFVILARKAAGLRPDTVLDAWLYETTRLTSLSFLRGERRRQWREQEAYMQSTLKDSTDDSVWTQLAPLLDEAMMRLGKKDREAVVLRYFKEKNLGEVAAAMKTTETAAQSRVHRAVEKLRKFFAKRGVTLSSVAIAGTISANSVQAAPVALAKSVTAVAIAKGAAASGSTLTIIKGALKLMAWTKTKTATLTGVVILLAAATTTSVIYHYDPPQRDAIGQVEFSKASWHFSGYGDPESAFQTWMWATKNGDIKSFLASFSPGVLAGFAGKPDSEIISPKDRASVDKVTGYRILDNQVLSDNEVVLSIATEGEGSNDVKRFSLQRIGKEWKISGKITR